jgi:type II secretory pathway component HofQ
VVEDDASSENPPKPPIPIPPDRLSPVANGGEPLVNDIFEDTDARQAIQSLAVQANASVILDEQVSGLTSAIIEDEPFELALRKVLLPLGCVFRKHNGQYLIGVTDPESSLFPLIAERVDYDVQHLSPQELTALLPKRFEKYLQVVDKRSRIVIEAPSETIEQILRELKRADRPVPQVLLEVVVCVFSPENRLRYGLDIEQGRHIGDAFHHLKLHDLAFSGTMSPVALGGMFSDFAVTRHYLQCLAQEGYVNIRAAPRVMAKDGEKAEISIGRETYFAVQPEGAEIYFRQDIEKVEAGITLDILPVVRGDNVTVMIERAEVSEDVRAVGTGPDLSSPYPLINRRRVTTTVDVKDGQTIVIGGLTQTQVVDRVNKVPLLGDIPIVGCLFKHVDKHEQEAEVAIFISPQIVPEPGLAAGLDDREELVR